MKKIAKYSIIAIVLVSIVIPSLIFDYNYSLTQRSAKLQRSCQFSLNTEVSDQSQIEVIHEKMRFSLFENYAKYSNNLLIQSTASSNISQIEFLFAFSLIEISVIDLNNSVTLPTRLIPEEHSTQLEISLVYPLQQNSSLLLYLDGTIKGISQKLSSGEYLFLYQYFSSTSVNVSIKVSLPIGGILSNNSNELNPVVFPAGYINMTDGQHLVIVWKNLVISYKQLFLIRYLLIDESLTDNSVSSSVLLYLLGGFLLGVIFSLGVLLFLKSLPHDKKHFFSFFNIKRRKSEKIRPVHLSIPEHKIIKKLEENQGSMLQSDLVDSLQFSKAAVSIYLKKLEEKGIIKKEPLGRTNRIILVATPTKFKINNNEK